MTSAITVERQGGDGKTGSVGVVTLNDPDKRNVLSTPMVEGLVAAFDELEADPSVGAVVVTGAPPAFCAGANLGNLGSMGSGGSGSGGEAEKSLRAVYEAFLRVSRCRLPTVAAVNGAAVGAGTNLALACDVRLAGRRARFDTRFLELGLHPGGGHTWMLQRIVGPGTAAAMVLFGQVLDGAQAAERGLVWACVDDDALMAEAVALAAKAAAAPRELVLRVKETMRDVQALDDHGAAVDRELVAQVWSLGQPFFAERLAAVQQRVSGSNPGR